MVRRWFGDAWLKAYQNVGKGKMAYGLYTIDHNPHFIYTEVLNNGVNEICIAGRSSMFTVFQLRLTPAVCVHQ